MNRLEQKYKETVKPSLMKEFGYTSVMECPKLEKVVINLGVGDAITNPKALEEAVIEKGFPYDTGVTITKASFYTQSAPETKPVGPELIYRWESYVKGGATNTSMECAPLFLIAASLGIRASCVMVSATNCKEYDGQGESQPLKNLEDRAIQVAIEGMRKIIRQDQQK